MRKKEKEREQSNVMEVRTRSNEGHQYVRLHLASTDAVE